MKILLLDTINKPSHKAAEIHKFELFSNLIKSDDEFHVISNENLSLKDIHNNVFIHIFKSKTHRGLLKYLSKIEHMIFIYNIMVSNDFDFLYTRNISFALFVQFIKKSKTKLVFEVNGIQFLEFEQIKKRKSISVRLFRLQEIFIAKKANIIISVSDQIKRYLIKNNIDENKIFVVENGANIELFHPIFDEKLLTEYKTKLGIKNENIITYVGALAPWQGAEYLIKAMQFVIKNYPDTKLLIIGEGIMRKELEYLADSLDLANNIFFLGAINYNEVPYYINISDICVAPFKKDRICSPMKIYEYMSCGKPIICSDIECIGHIIKKSKAGILVEPENYFNLQEAIIQLLNDEQLRNEMGNSARDYLYRNNTWQIAAQKIIKIFHDMKNLD